MKGKITKRANKNQYEVNIIFLLQFEHLMMQPVPWGHAEVLPDIVFKFIT